MYVPLNGFAFLIDNFLWSEALKWCIEMMHRNDAHLALLYCKQANIFFFVLFWWLIIFPVNTLQFFSLHMLMLLILLEEYLSFDLGEFLLLYSCWWNQLNGLLRWANHQTSSIGHIYLLTNISWNMEKICYDALTNHASILILKYAKIWVQLNPSSS